MDKLGLSSKAADLLGVFVTTLRRWKREGKLISDRTSSGYRRYFIIKL